MSTKQSAAKRGKNNPMYGRCGERCPAFGKRGEGTPMFGKHHSQKSREKMSISKIGKLQSEESNKKRSESETGEKNPFYGKRHSEETREKMRNNHRNVNGINNPNFGKSVPYNRLMKMVESKIGGFWYGNVRYPASHPYCECWCPNLWQRIDEAQNYQSILSGKTKDDNGGRALSRHHVYWQPKACCEWDEDVHGYYAWINTGTVKKPHWHKHAIPGDPNKFVLITSREHGMITKDKLRWIRIFEELIETKLGGVCYLLKE